MPRRIRRSRSAKATFLALGAVAFALPASASSAPATHRPNLGRGTVLPGTSCPVFPSNNVWNTPVTGLPVNPHSATWLASMNSSSTNLHPDFGPSGDPTNPYGIAWQIAPASTPMVAVTFLYASESDRGPYPFSAATPIEGGPHATGDRHALIVNAATCTLYELYDAHYAPGGKSTAGSGAIWRLRSNALRPATWTSADAAGLPILPGLVNYDEAASGTMHHAIRFTTQCTQQAFLWPARHQAGQSSPSCPPMGARFRLRASFHLARSVCGTICQNVLTTMKTYGLILADNGSNWYFQGTADTRWTDAQMVQLKQIPASAFQAIDESCLMVSPSSGRALQAGSAAFGRRCA